MKPRRHAPRFVPSVASQEARAQLVVALRNAGLDVEATLIAGDDKTARVDGLDDGVDGLDDARTKLLARLHRRSDDFSATTALKALDTFSAGRRAESPLTTQEARRRPRVSDAA
jgi:hypothetical protein